MIKWASIFLTSGLLLVAASCNSDTKSEAQKIIDKAIEQHGGDLYENSRIDFKFRDIDYVAEHQNGRFMYQRTIDDSVGVITDRLTNEGLNRMVDGERVTLAPEDSIAYASSVNSVIYFALLPYKLNDPAVISEYVGDTSIDGEPYYEIEVNFRKMGGGRDHQDTFVYWIHRNDFTMDYLVYRYHIDGGGTRFREAKNVRKIQGIRFSDYNNYGGHEMERPLEKYDSYFEADTLNKISEINLENIEVTLLDKN